MSDDPVRSWSIPMRASYLQDYFVRRQCQPAFQSIRFDGVERRDPGAGLVAALDDPALERSSSALPPFAQHCPDPRAARHRDRRRTDGAMHCRLPFIAGGGEGARAKIMDELGLPTTPSAIATIMARCSTGCSSIQRMPVWTGRSRGPRRPTPMRDDADQARWRPRRSPWRGGSAPPPRAVTPRILLPVPSLLRGQDPAVSRAEPQPNAKHSTGGSSSMAGVARQVVTAM